MWFWELNSKSIASWIIEIPYEKIDVKIFEGDQFKPEFKKLNPTKQIPVMVDGDFVLSESHTIMRYLACSQKCDDHWYPSDLKKRALVDQYLDWHHTNLRTGCHLYLTKKIIYPLFNKEATESEIKDLHKELIKSWKIMNDRLSKSKYLWGDELTLADISGFCEIIDSLQLPDYGLDKFTHLKDWMNRMKSIPEVAKVHLPMMTNLGLDVKAKL